MSATRAIFFDAVGTLIHPEPSAAAVYAEIGKRFGSHYTQGEIAQRFRAAFTRQEAIDRAKGWVTSAEREHSRWRQIVDEVLDDVTDADSCFALLYRHFAEPQAWRCAPETESVLAELAALGYRLGLASNYDERLFSLAAGLRPLRSLGGCVVASSEIGHRKPSVSFFAALCDKMVLVPQEICHVGDDPDIDYAGARAAGLRAILFDPHDRHADRTLNRIRNLAEVKDIISRL